MAIKAMDDPEHWTHWAEEMRVIAETMKDPLTKAMVLRIASDYDALAARAAERLRTDARLAQAASPRTAKERPALR